VRHKLCFDTNLTVKRIMKCVLLKLLCFYIFAGQRIPEFFDKVDSLSEQIEASKQVSRRIQQAFGEIRSVYMQLNKTC
jgi:hypothetical protein